MILRLVLLPDPRALAPQTLLKQAGHVRVFVYEFRVNLDCRLAHADHANLLERPLQISATIKRVTTYIGLEHHAPKRPPIRPGVVPNATPSEARLCAFLMKDERSETSEVSQSNWVLGGLA